jgi:hypothetical protein
MKSRRLLIVLITIAFAIALTEAVSFAGLAVAQRVLPNPPIRVSRILKEQSNRVRRFIQTTDHPEDLDANLGWKYRSGFARGRNQITAQGLRSGREYALQPPTDVIRIAAFGDSFVYGSEVGPNDAWARRIEVQNPHIEVLNYGVPGYGVDQALLRFRIEGRRLAPHFAIMGFAPDDLRRLVNVYRPFISTRERPLAKPRFLLRNDTLVLLPSPLPDTASYNHLLSDPRWIEQFGRFDQWYQPEVYENPLYDWSATVRLAVTVWRQMYNRFFDDDRLLNGDTFNPASEAFRLQIALFDQFIREARAAHTEPMLVIFPDRESLVSIARGQPSIYAPLTEEMRRRGIEFLDLADVFPRPLDSARMDSWFASKGHYSVEGNRIVAEAVTAAVLARNSHQLGGSASSATQN